MTPAGSGRTSLIPRCALCGEPLGVYEPLIEVDGEQVRRTSRAAAGDLSCRDGASCYHERCFDQGSKSSPSGLLK